MEKAIFGAGCFWGVQDAFAKVPGVVSTAVGYSGGTTKDPTYKDVCSGRTGHAEVCLVEFDKAIVSFDKLLEIFWQCHNPTTINRQGPDIGSQYRSGIFFSSEEQQKAALASKESLNAQGQFKSPIVTEITPASEFYRAEEYHQNYLEKNGIASCH